MRFEINKIENKIILKDGVSGTSAEVFAFGALLNKFSVVKNGEETNVINGFEDVADAEQNIRNGFKSAKLSPYVCRVRDGEYSFEDRNYKVDKFYLNKEAIHGLLFDAMFEMTRKESDDEGAMVALLYHYNKKEEGFPFEYDIEVTYTLQKENVLSVITTITNRGGTDMPLCDGWHPYFKLGEKVDNLKVQMNTKQLVEFDARLLPTGKILPFDRFGSPESFCDTSFDHCFLLNENADSACVLRDEAEGLELKIIPDKSYPYLQIYTPSDRESIAVENLSSAPDAFNNGMGLIVAKPGEIYQFKTTYQLTVF